MKCPNCSETLSERGCFCKACGGQTRCLQCRELLEPAAKACVECGTLIGQGRSVDGANGSAGDDPPTTLPANRNTITYREDRNSRDFQASLTDTSMQSLGGVFGELFAQRVGARSQVGQHGKFQTGEDAVIDVQKLLPPADGAHEAPPPPPASPLATDKDRLLKIFSPKGESLELADNRLKAKNGADYLRKLTYLFLYAHECHGRPSTTEHDLKSVLKAAKIWDSSGNAQRWLKKRVGIVDEGDDHVKLNATGREEAQKALTAILDASIPDDWNPDKATATKRAPRKKRE